MDELERELKVGFLDEALQLITDAEQSFLALEANPGDQPTLEKIFRIAHNIKGSSRAVGFEGLGAFTHTFENVLIKLKSGELSASPPVVSLLLRCNDHLRVTIEALKADLNAQVDHSALATELEAAQRGGLASNVTESIEVATPPADHPGFAEEPIETTAPAPEPMITSERDVNTATTPPEAVTPITPEAPVATAPSTPTPAAPPPGNASTSNAANVDESVRVSLARLDRLVNFVGELVILRAMVETQARQTGAVELIKTVSQMAKVTKEVQDISLSLRMLPLRATFQKMQRIVRDTASTLNKKIQLEVVGDEIEVDKTVLERLGDPLVHMIRNACDHGIEPPEARAAEGKPEHGTVRLEARTESGRLLIEIRDDGKGINPEVLRKKAQAKGILRPGQSLTDAQAIDLIFASGFSTKEQVSEVSGRGVGMDVVKTNIEALQGTISVDSEVGRGSRMLISLPLSLSIIESVLVRSDAEEFVIPMVHIHESVKTQPRDVQHRIGIGDVLMLRGEPIPIYDLRKLLGRKAEPRKHDAIALICRARAETFSVLVDDILEQQQVVIKPLGPELRGTRGFGGSAILGDGRPALILELPDLVRSTNGQRRAA